MRRCCLERHVFAAAPVSAMLSGMLQELYCRSDNVGVVSLAPDTPQLEAGYGPRTIAACPVGSCLHQSVAPLAGCSPHRLPAQVPLPAPETEKKTPRPDQGLGVYRKLLIVTDELSFSPVTMMLRKSVFK